MNITNVNLLRVYKIHKKNLQKDYISDRQKKIAKLWIDKHLEIFGLDYFEGRQKI